MPRDVGIGPIDRRLVKAGLDDPGLPFSSRSRNNSRILGIDSLSAGILFSAFRQKEQAYLGNRSSADRGTEDAQIVAAGDLARLLGGEAAA